MWLTWWRPLADGYGELRRFVSALYISTLVWRLVGFFVPFPFTLTGYGNGSLVAFLNIISQRFFSPFCNEIPFVLRSGYCGLYGICGFVSVYVLIFEHLGTFFFLFNFPYWTGVGDIRAMASYTCACLPFIVMLLSTMVNVVLFALLWNSRLLF